LEGSGRDLVEILSRNFLGWIEESSLPCLESNPVLPESNKKALPFGWIRHSEKLQAIKEKAGTLRRANVPSEYKSDVVLLEIMSPDSSVKRVAGSGVVGVRFKAWAVTFVYQLMAQPESFRCLLGAEATKY
jgi:hypothetical protein